MNLRQTNVCAFGEQKSQPSTKVTPTLTGWIALTLMVLAFGARPAAALVHASILVDAQTGKVLYAYHANRRTYPASLTKLMTLYITFQRLESGRLTLESRLHVSRHAAAQQPTKLWLQPGSTITVRSAILGITTVSANDAAVVLAENIGGSEWHFARMMNREARRLGMTRTTFYNASGLPNYRQKTTARDMSKLAIALIHTFPQYYHFFSVRDFWFHGHIVYGHDYLLNEFAGVDGMKTGYVRASGYNIVTSAVRNHRRLVGVVLGGVTARARDLQMIALLHRGFATSSSGSTLVAHASPRHYRHVRRARRVHRRIAVAGLVNTAAESSRYGRRDWVIQVGGGFRSEYTVRRVLHSARMSAPAPLRRGHALVVKLRGRQYRARFSDLSHERALQACSALERKRFTCQILAHYPAYSQVVASTGTYSRSSQND